MLKNARFRVTDRDTEEIFGFLGLTYEDFRPGDTVFVAGSGLRQRFERDIAPRVSRIIACDPSLAVEDGWRVIFNKYDPEGKHAVTYVEIDYWPNSVPASEFIQSRLIDIPQNIELVTSKIPLIAAEDSSIDLGIDVIGASNYMSVEMLGKYLQEIFRVLKPGGQFRLGPLNRMDWWEDIFVIAGIIMPKDIELKRFDIWNDSIGLIVKKKAIEF